MKSVTASRSASTKRSTDQAGSGAVDENIFLKSFDEVPRISVYSARDVEERLSKIKETLIDVSLDWEKRVNALKEIRSLFVSEAVDLIDFVGHLKALEVGLQTSLKDLRSQVVREACITIAFMAVRLDVKFDVCCESLMPSFISLIQNSAKVMSTSSVVAVTFIIKNVTSARIIPTLTVNITSKSVSIRKQCLEFIALLLSTWPKHSIERHGAGLQEAIKRGLTDADSEARAHARRAFESFCTHFPEQGCSLMSSLDSSKQRQLKAQLSNPSMFDEIKTDSSATARVPSRIKSVERTSSSGYGQDVTRTMNGYDRRDGNNHSGMSILKRNHSLSSENGTRSGHFSSLRRTSTSNTSAAMVRSVQPSRTRSTAVSQSQPASRSGSRSGSPTGSSTGIPRYHPPTDHYSTPSRIPAVGSRRSAIPHSQGCSRETSPHSRSGFGERSRQSSSAAASPSVRRKNSLTSLRLVEFGKDLEAAVTDVWRMRVTRKGQSDDASSDAGSEVSDGGFSSASSSYRSVRSTDISPEMSDSINLLVSGSWADRREGLLQVQRFLKADRYFSGAELKKLTEIFTRMFHDPHSKVFTLFIDTFSLFISAYSSELLDWFPTCLHRLLNKSGADVLGSLLPKLSKALDALRDSFPHSVQFACVTKFIVEQSQMSNLKLKSALLSYIMGLVNVMEPVCFMNTSDNRLAVSRIITWASEPKSPDVRKMAQSVLYGLHVLNAAELATIISVLPKSFQEGAGKILSSAAAGSGDQLSRVSRSGSLTNPLRAMSRTGGGDGYHDSANPDLYHSFQKTSQDLQNLTQLGGQFDFLKLNGISSSLTSSSAVEDPSEEREIDEEMFVEILSELSMAENCDEKHRALDQLTVIIKSCADDLIWEKQFKTVLLLVLQTMRDENGKVRAHAIRVLKDLLLQQSQRFKIYAELTIFKLLEFEKDSDKEAVRAAEDCGETLAQVIDPDQCISVLNPVSLTADFPINLAAIKMETRVIERCSETDVRNLMPVITPGLVKGFEHNESSVRKCSMLCLIALHQCVGEDLLPFLSQLSPSKMKLLNLYIKREAEKKEMVGSEPTSPSPI